MAIVRFAKIAELMGNTQANESTFRRFRDYDANSYNVLPSRKEVHNYNWRRWTEPFFPRFARTEVRAPSKMRDNNSSIRVPPIIDDRVVLFKRARQKYVKRSCHLWKSNLTTVNDVKIFEKCLVQRAKRKFRKWHASSDIPARCESAMLTMLHAAAGSDRM